MTNVGYILCKCEEECLTDYKFFCFGGKPEIVYVSKDIAKNPRTDFFDMNFNHLPIRMKDPGADILPEKPVHFEEMKELATVLSKGNAHMRVDFYEVNDSIYAGELTFYHCSGFQAVYPEEWNQKLGDMIKLPRRTT